MTTSGQPASADSTLATLAGIDQLDLPLVPRRTALARLWSAGWPKLAAIAVALALWQVVVLSGWRPTYLLPGPVDVFQRLLRDLTAPDHGLVEAVLITLRRAVVGFIVAIVIGVVVGIGVIRF